MRYFTFIVFYYYFTTCGLLVALIGLHDHKRTEKELVMDGMRFFIENAFCVGLFQSFYDGGDLDENGCFLF